MTRHFNGKFEMSETFVPGKCRILHVAILVTTVYIEDLAAEKMYKVTGREKVSRGGDNYMSQTGEIKLTVARNKLISPAII